MMSESFVGALMGWFCGGYFNPTFSVASFLFMTTAHFSGGFWKYIQDA